MVAFLRGDHQVNETKLNGDRRDSRTAADDAGGVGAAHRRAGGLPGPVGIVQIMTEGSLNGLKSGKALDKLKGVLRDNPNEGLRTIVVVDLGLQGRKNLVAGANKLDYHYSNVTPGRDFTLDASSPTSAT